MKPKPLTLNLSEMEMEVLETLSKRKSMSKTALLRQCLRLYQLFEDRLERGEKLFFENHKSEKAELFLL